MRQLELTDLYIKQVAEHKRIENKKPPKIWQSLTSCTIDCPECGETIDWNRDCKRCGQAIDWSAEAMEKGTKKSPDLKAVEWYKARTGEAPGPVSSEYIQKAKEAYNKCR